MKDAQRLLKTWSFLVPLLFSLAGCAAGGVSDTPDDSNAPGLGASEGFSELADKDDLDAIEQELSFRPLCSKCGQVCKPLRGYFKSLCTRACQKVCVNECENCKNQCKTLQGSQRQACLNACSSSAACGGGAKCGNGRLEGGEQCDDGNTVSGDGCSKTCQSETPVCGNGRLESGEECDDNNSTAGDGCSPTCKIEPPPPLCGNGIVQPGEECDDGNVAPNDGCGPTCITERCGDTSKQSSEECDDGNVASNDGCSAGCKTEVCGDGIAQPPREQCDDGNTNNADGCHDNCTLNTVTCGDGDVDPGEACDDGNNNGNDGCGPNCLPEECGDGIKQTNEDCDDGNRISCDGCAPTCRLEARGDGTRCPSEQCDDGNSSANDGCSPTCVAERCGDGVKQTNEQCDDGNVLPGDGCEIDCSVAGPTCESCRNLNCRDYLGVDLVAGCFTAINPEFGANAADPAFIQDCVNTVSCARANNCAYSDEKQAAGCYCGSATIDDCTTTGPAPDAPCAAQWRTATRATTNTGVQERFTDLSFPSGWAYFLLDCDRASCNSAAVGNCTEAPRTTSSKPSYLVPVAPGVVTKAILTTGDSPNKKPDGTPYRLVGLVDGSGAFDNGDGTFTWLINHELGATAGIARAHGGTGAFVSRWVVRKSDLSVVSGQDLIQSVTLWNPLTSTYGAGTNIQFGRFCSADLPGISAFYDSASSTGYNGHLFMNGEETGNEGRAMAHAMNGLSWELPRLGKFSWENSVASPFAQAKTIVVGTDDSTPGQVYVYVGTKTNAGLPIDRAGLTNGTLYGVAVTGFASEPSATGIPAGPFTLASLGNVENTTGAALEAASGPAGVTLFNRPEDGAWDPAHPNDFYFVTTNGITAPSRLWRLRFTDIAQPQLGGTLEMVLDGTEGQIMLDNIGIDARGHIVLQEDPGNNARIAQVWRYDIATDRLVSIAQHDPALFTTGSPTFITQDEEASGAIDATAILGAGWWLMTDQIHAGVSGELVEQGQITALFDPGSL